MYTGESFKKKGALKHFERFKSPGSQEPSLVSRAGVLQHFRAMGRTWGPRAPQAPHQPQDHCGASRCCKGCRRVQVCPPEAEHLRDGGDSTPPGCCSAQSGGRVVHPQDGMGHSSLTRGSLPGPALLCSSLFPLPMWSCRRTDSSPHPFLL